MKNDLGDGILLSGGLDTSIIAKIASKYTPLTAITARLENAPAPDIKYATLMAKDLNLEHSIHTFDIKELYENLPETIRITKSFDPMEVRNSVVIYIGLHAAKENGISAVLTGDGADELFAGYSYLFNFDAERMALELEKLASIMTFSSERIAKQLGLQAKLPYLEANVKRFALRLNPHYKIGSKDGKTYGKWILRKAYERVLPHSIIWRVKTPIEAGSGTSTLPQFFNNEISDLEFMEKKKTYQVEDHVTIRDKEHLFYYEIYRSIFGVPSPSTKTGKVCPQCNSNVKENATYCPTCGAYPI